jgi:hypothetical protein
VDTWAFLGSDMAVRWWWDQVTAMNKKEGRVSVQEAEEDRQQQRVYSELQQSCTLIVCVSV